MRFEERVRSEMRREAAARGHSMSRFGMRGDDAFPFRSDCSSCGGYIELGFGPQGSRSFSPRGRAPFESCNGRRRGARRRQVTT